MKLSASALGLYILFISNKVLGKEREDMIREMAPDIDYPSDTCY